MNWIKHIRFLFLLALLMIAFNGYSQGNGVDFKIKGQYVYLEIENHQTNALRDSVLIGCGFDSTMISSIMVGLQSDQNWTVFSLDKLKMVLSRDIKTLSDMDMGAGAVHLSGDLPKWEPNGAISAHFGYNETPIPSIEISEENNVKFRLEDHENAQEVILSGSFNGWSTLSQHMIKNNGHWETELTLIPGVYDYKFVIDGKWKIDPLNKNKRDDGFGNVNSRFVVPNHMFVLKNYQEAKKVLLAGSFNNWDDRNVKLLPRKEGWSLPVYLQEGTYTYKFIVDGKDWITDPVNSKNREDGDGNINSVLEIGDAYLFVLKGYDNAEKVVLSGSFNDWNMQELAMERNANGWQLPYVLAAGNYEYKFIVDGNWTLDPSNPKTTGEGDYENSVLIIEPNFTFRLEGFSDAKEVLLSGSFNMWADPGYRMELKDGVWSFPIHLWPAKYTYKFKVDGKWVADPANALRERNQFDSFNSVLWIEH